MEIAKHSYDLIGHKHPIYALVGSSKSHIVFTAGGEGAVVEWSLKKKTFLKIVFHMKASIYCLHSISNPNIIIAGDRLGNIAGFDFESQQVVFHFKAHQSAIFAIQSDNENFYSVSEDGCLNCYSLADYSLIKQTKLNQHTLRTITLNPNNNECLIGGKEQFLNVFDKNDFTHPRPLIGHSLPVFSSCFNENQQHYITGARDAQINVWDTKGQELIHSIPAHLFAINDLLNIPSKEIIVSASRDKNIKIWDDKNYQLLQKIDSSTNGHKLSVNRLCYTTFENTMLSVGDDKILKVWEITV